MRFGSLQGIRNGVMAAVVTGVLLVAGQALAFPVTLNAADPRGDSAERLKLHIETADEPLSEAPEPGTMWLIGSGLFGIGVLSMRRQLPRETDDEA